MNKRLFWNFELSHPSDSAFSDLLDEPPSSLRWEARYFWPETAIICLSGLNANFFNLNMYDIKERQDTYYVLDNYPLNIKQRRDELLYKPLIEQHQGCYGFAKKINLSTQNSFSPLPGADQWLTKDLLDVINQQSRTIVVKKIALIYKLDTHPKVKLEFSRLNVLGQLFFSLCVEGRSQTMVSTISQHILPHQQPSDYVHFLKDILR